MLSFGAFLIGAVVFSLPPVSQAADNVFHYLWGDVPLHGGDIEVSWSDATELIRSGHARSIAIPHGGRITIRLDNGLLVEAQEPYSEATHGALGQAPNRRWIRIAIE